LLPFNKRFDLKNAAMVNGLLKDVANAHVKIQKLESGANASKFEKAHATFAFLHIAGWYPAEIQAGAMKLPVRSIVMLANEAKDLFMMQYFSDEYRTEPVGIIGTPDARSDVYMLSNKFVLDTITTAFPTISITETQGKAVDGSLFWHVTLRPNFMQNPSDNGKPLVTGTCSCSDRRVAYMQAFTRMVHAYLTEVASKLKPAKTLAELVGEEKYGKSTWWGDPKDAPWVRPNDLLNVLRTRAPESKDNGVWSVKLPEKATIDGVELKSGDTILWSPEHGVQVKKNRGWSTRLLRQSMAAQKKAYLDSFGKLPEAEKAWALIEKEVWKAFGVNPT
jgi:hypothetical protein